MADLVQDKSQIAALRSEGGEGIVGGSGRCLRESIFAALHSSLAAGARLVWAVAHWPSGSQPRCEKGLIWQWQLSGGEGQALLC
jgi:hypothetical protein